MALPQNDFDHFAKSDILIACVGFGAIARRELEFPIFTETLIYGYLGRFAHRPVPDPCDDVYDLNADRPIFPRKGDGAKYRTRGKSSDFSAPTDGLDGA